MLGVVEQHERSLAEQSRGDCVDELLTRLLAHLQSLRDRCQDQRSVAYRRERHPEHTAGNLLGYPVRHFKSEACLARAAGTGEREQPHLMVQNQRGYRRRLRGASDEPVWRGGQIRPRRVWLRCECEHLLLVEDLLVERLQLVARIDAEVLEQTLSSSLIGAECFRLPAGAVEGQHQLAAQALAMGVFDDQDFEFTDQAGVASESQFGLDPLLDRLQTETFEPYDLGLCERLERELRERRAAPERERLLQHARCSFGMSTCQCGLTVGEQQFESVHVERLSFDLEQIAGGLGDEG